ALSDYYNNCACNTMLGDLYRKRSFDKKNYVFNDRTLFILNYLDQKPKEQPLRILEIGCSSGGFLANLKSAITQELPNVPVILHGIDIDASAVAQKVDPELHLEAKSIEEFSQTTNYKFDLVVHFELIEHLIDPFAFMRYIHSVLN